MLDTSSVFLGAAVLLALLMALCLYLLINNFRARQKIARRTKFVSQEEPRWLRIIFDESDEELKAENQEQVEWTLEEFLRLFNTFEDPELQNRLTQLTEQHFSAHLSHGLASRSKAIRQLALVTVKQLNVSTLSAEVAALSPETDLENYLQAAILNRPLEQPNRYASILHPTINELSHD